MYSKIWCDEYCLIFFWKLNGARKMIGTPCSCDRSYLERPLWSQRVRSCPHMAYTGCILFFLCCILHLCCHRGNLGLTDEHIKLPRAMQKADPLCTTHLKSYRCTQTQPPSYFLIWLITQLFKYTPSNHIF